MTKTEESYMASISLEGYENPLRKNVLISRIFLQTPNKRWMQFPLICASNLYAKIRLMREFLKDS